MINAVTIDKDILLSTIVECLGGGIIDWENKEVELNTYFLNQKYFNKQELLIKAIAEGRRRLYKWVKFGRI